MIKRCIGIDIGRTYVRAVQIARTPEGLVVEKVFGMQTRRSTDSMSKVLQSLMTEHGFDRRAEVAVSLPSQAVAFVEIQAEEVGLQAIQSGETLKLRNDLPIAVEDAIVQVCSTRALPKGKYSVLVATASGEAIRDQLHSLAEGNIRPTTVDASILATHTTLVMNHAEAMIGTAMVLCVDDSALTLAVTQDGKILMVRNIPVFCDEGASLSADQTAEIIEREVEITWRRLFGAGPDGSLYVFLVSAPKTVDQLVAAIRERIECQIVIANPYAKLKMSSDHPSADFPMCTAVGLALRALAIDSGGHSDFLATYNARMRPGDSIRKELIVCAALVAITAGVWFMGLFVRLSALESEYAGLKSRIQTVFHQALPQEKNVVNPLAQLQQKIDTFRKEYEVFSSFRPGRLSPLEVMSMLTTHSPREGGLKFHDLLITADSAQVVGTCDSFAGVSDWQRLLQQMGGFEVVEIQDQKKDARTGQVEFTLSMSLRPMEP